MFAKVILGSIPTNGAPPLVTIHTRHPRVIHAEWMTHRVFSRNARSSRAVPVNTMLKEIRETPFIPWHWGKNQKGMQAGAEHNETVLIGTNDRGPYVERQDAWLHGRNQAVELAETFAEAGYHKQIVNRLLEPFMWIDVLTSSTSWANFEHLRNHKDAEPHFRDLAQMVKEAIGNAELQTLEPGQWHLPYVPTADFYSVFASGQNEADVKSHDQRSDEAVAILKKLSVARCARISYAPFDGDASIEKELQRYDMLVGSDPLHASPAEHQATPDNDAGFEREGNYANEHLAGNLGPGWIQFRKTLANEFVAG